MTEQSPSSVQSELQQAEKLLAAKHYDEALTILREYWLLHPDNLQAVRLLSRLMKSLGRTDLSGSLYKLTESEDALKNDIQNLFESGFKLIDERELHLAIMLLKRCADKVPNDATINYELGFALMSIHLFDEAIEYLERAMPETDDFDTILNLHVCYTLTRDLSKAGEALDAMSKKATDDEQRKEIEHRRTGLKRLEKFQKKALTPRDWLYCLYGTITLSEPEVTELSPILRSSPLSDLTKDTAGKSGSVSPDYKAVAWTLIVLEKLLAELGYEFDVIEFYSSMSRPLAEAFAHKLDLPVRSFGGANNKDRALMIMAWAPNIIGPHKSFIPNNKHRVLFAYGLSPLQPLPLTPEIIAELCDDLRLPWAETSEEEAEFRPNPGRIDVPTQQQAAATDKILEMISEIESNTDLIQTVQKLCDYYKPKQDKLVIGNPEHFPERPEYTAEIVY